MRALTLLLLAALAARADEPPLVATAGEDRVELRWAAGPGEVLLERADVAASGSAAWLALAALPREAARFLDAGLVRGGATYRYRLRPADGAGPEASVEVTLPAPDQLGRVVGVACGGHHTLALDADGAVWAFGNGLSGELGGSDQADSPRPRRVQGLPRIAAVGAGRQTSAAVDADGDVWVWGRAPAGVPGGALRTPVRVAWGGARARTVEVMDGGLFVLATDGRVWSGGAAAPLAPGTEVVSISAGGTYALALCRDGGLLAFVHRGAFGPVTLPRPARSAAAGAAHGVAVLDDGSLWTWGRDTAWQLGEEGRGTLDPRPLARAGTGHALVGAGTTFSLVAGRAAGPALAGDPDGPWTVMGWGTGPFGASGLRAPRAPEERTPVVVGDRATSPVVALRGGLLHGAVLRRDGRLATFGSNMSGQLGTGRVGRLAPALVPGLDEVVDVAAGHTHSLAVRRSGEVWAWGRNQDGQLGDGSGRRAQLVPARAAGLSGASRVAAGADGALALDVEGTAWGWGQAFGHPGRVRPTVVEPLRGAVRALACGSHGVVFARRDGTVGSWDDGRSAPTAVAGPTRTRAVACGAGFALALAGDGSVWSWGHDGPALGRGTAAVGGTPGQVAGLPGPAVQVACGKAFALALCEDGTVWAWGDGSVGQLGAPGEPVAHRATRVPALEEVASIACGREHALALLGDGSVWAWGENGDGRIGDGTYRRAPRPTRVLNLPAARTIGAGSAHSLAVDRAGRVWSWGCASSGRLGSGETSDEDELRTVVAPGPPG